jgi:hypothetical protein
MSGAARVLLHWTAPAILAGITVVAFVPNVREAAERTEVMTVAAGVYGWERIAGASFRWTGPRAVLRERVRGAVLVLPILVARPDVDSEPLHVRVRIDGIDANPIALDREGWSEHRIDLRLLLGEGPWMAARALTIELEVNRPYVPARAGQGTDTRELGVGLGPIAWAGRPR